MAKSYIKAGLAAGKLYDTINEMTGISGETPEGQPIQGQTSFGPNNELVITPEGEVIFTPEDGVVKGTFENAQKLNNKEASYYGKDEDTIHIYLHTKSGTTHNLQGEGKNGKVLIKYDFNTGDTFTVNGSSVTAYTGGEKTEELYRGRWMYFLLDDSNNINFIGGGGTSKLIKKAGDTFTGTVNFGSSAYNIQTNGDATFNEVRASKVFNAVYNDYAEYIPRGEETEPGDILALDLESENEQYKKATFKDIPVAIESNEYGIVLGGEAGVSKEEQEKKYIPATMVGRVHAKVIGKTKKGMWLAPTEIPGIGRAIPGVRPYNAIGYVLENTEDLGIHKVKVWVGGNFG